MSSVLPALEVLLAPRASPVLRAPGESPVLRAPKGIEVLLVLPALLVLLVNRVLLALLVPRENGAIRDPPARWAFLVGRWVRKDHKVQRVQGGDKETSALEVRLGRWGRLFGLTARRFWPRWP